MMPSIRKKKTRDKRSRRSDVISQNENLDVMLGNFPGNNFEEQDNSDEIDVNCAAFNGWLLFLMVLYATSKSG